MLPIKLLGCAMILSAGGIAAVSAVRREKRRLTVLDAWIDLLFYIRAQIDCYLMPVNEILDAADTEILSGCMCATPHPDLSVLYASSAAYLGKEGARLLSSFVREIGGGYRDEQLRRCDYYIAALRKIREKTADEQPARIRLAVTLSVSAAIGAAILLW